MGKMKEIIIMVEDGNSDLEISQSLGIELLVIQALTCQLRRGEE